LIWENLTPLNMTWSRTISLPRPLRGVSRLAKLPAEDWAGFLGRAEQTAFERGRREGERALSHLLLEQRTEMADLQNGLIQSLRAAIPQVLSETENAVLALALDAARKVVAGLPVDSEVVEAVVQEALRQVEDTAEVIVQLHPEDMAILRKSNSPILSESPNGRLVRFVSSAEVGRGGCLVQTRFGLIDARRETKFAQLERTIAP